MNRAARVAAPVLVALTYARVVARARVGSMTTGRLTEQAFDPASDANLDVPAPKR